MPLHDVYCEGCDYADEIILKLNEETPLCPKCGCQTKKAMSSSTFVLCGGGWASDGYSKAQ